MTHVIPVDFLKESRWLVTINKGSWMRWGKKKKFKGKWCISSVAAGIFNLQLCFVLVLLFAAFFSEEIFIDSNASDREREGKRKKKKKQKERLIRGSKLTFHTFAGLTTKVQDIICHRRYMKKPVSIALKLSCEYPWLYTFLSTRNLRERERDYVTWLRTTKHILDLLSKRGNHPLTK